jgi:hypothetical protein
MHSPNIGNVSGEAPAAPDEEQVPVFSFGRESARSEPAYAALMLQNSNPRIAGLSATPSPAPAGAKPAAAKLRPEPAVISPAPWSPPAPALKKTPVVA